MKARTKLLSGLIALFLILGLFAPQAVEAKKIIINAEEALLYLNPAGTQPVTNDATQTLQVMVDDVVDLTAYHLELTYDQADITVTAVRNGAVLVSPTEPGFFEPTNWETGDDTGTIMFGVAQQGTGGDPKPVTLTEPGVLLEIDFTIDAQGETSLTLNASKSLLVSWPDAFEIDFVIPLGQGSAVYTLDTVAPAVSAMVAYGDGMYPDVTAVGMTFTVGQGYVVDTIGITMSEPVTVLAGTEVTLAGVPYGLVTVSADGLTLTVTPYAGNETANLAGTFIFVIPTGSVKDLAGNALTTLEATLIVTNLVPVAVDDAYSTLEDTVLTVATLGVLENDVDYDALTAAVVTEPANGTLTLNADGGFVYTPDMDWHGTDSFTYKANDGLADSNVATVTITVNSVNDTPVAVDDFYTTDEDTTLTVAAPGVLANDSDVDLDPMEVVLVTDVLHGDLSILGDGSFTYKPDPNFYGIDTFVYQLVTYPGLQSSWTDEATVTITVNPINDAPVLGSIPNATIPELVPFTFTAMATDVDLPAQVLTFSLVDAPEGAAITAAGVFTWTPTEAQGAGVYTFTVKVCDAGVPALCDEQVVILTVSEVNTAPVAQAQTVTTPEETALDVTLVATDADGDTLTYTIVAQPTHGTVTLAGTKATYTPDPDYFGPDSFTFKANDGLVDSNVATVTITVTNVNDAPVAVDDEYTMAEKETLTIAAPGVLDNDSDVDGDAFTAILVDNVLHGTLTLNADGSFTYTPNEFFNGTDSFTYKAKDAALESEMAVVTITVTPVNDWPIANDDFYEVVTGNLLVKDALEGVLANDVLVDPDEQVSIQILEDPQHGTLSMNDDGSFDYFPNPGYMGTDTFRYMVLSVRAINAEWSDDALVTITVKPYMGLFLPIIWR